MRKKKNLCGDETFPQSCQNLTGVTKAYTSKCSEGTMKAGPMHNAPDNKTTTRDCKLHTCPKAIVHTETSAKTSRQITVIQPWVDATLVINPCSQRKLLQNNFCKLAHFAVNNPCLLYLLKYAYDLSTVAHTPDCNLLIPQ